LVYWAPTGVAETGIVRLKPLGNTQDHVQNRTL